VQVLLNSDPHRPPPTLFSFFPSLTTDPLKLLLFPIGVPPLHHPHPLMLLPLTLRVVSSKIPQLRNCMWWISRFSPVEASSQTPANPFFPPLPNKRASETRFSLHSLRFCPPVLCALPALTWPDTPRWLVDRLFFDAIQVGQFSPSRPLFQRVFLVNVRPRFFTSQLKLCSFALPSPQGILATAKFVSSCRFFSPPWT